MGERPILPVESGPFLSLAYIPPVVVDFSVVVVVEESDAGATGDIGVDELVLSSVVVVDEVVGMVSSLAQPARVSRPAAAMEARIRFFIRGRDLAYRKFEGAPHVLIA